MKTPLSRLVKLVLPVLAMVGFVAAPAHAASITVTQNFTLSYDASKSGNGTATDSAAGFVDFNFFDASLGTLTGVTVDLASTANLTATATGSGLIGSDKVTGTVSLGATMGAGSIPSLGVGSGSVIASCGYFFGGCQDSKSLTINLFNAIGPASSAFTGNPAMAWTVNLLANLTVNNQVAGVGGGTGSASGVWAGTVTATYDYIPTPEPGSMLLLGTGLLFVASRVRRRLNARN